MYQWCRAAKVGTVQDHRQPSRFWVRWRREAWKARRSDGGCTTPAGSQPVFVPSLANVVWLRELLPIGPAKASQDLVETCSATVTMLSASSSSIYSCSPPARRPEATIACNSPLDCPSAHLIAYIGGCAWSATGGQVSLTDPHHSHSPIHPDFKSSAFCSTPVLARAWRG